MSRIKGIRNAAMFVSIFVDTKLSNHAPSTSLTSVLGMFFRKGINQNEESMRDITAKIMIFILSFLFFIKKNPIENIDTKTVSCKWEINKIAYNIMNEM